LKLNFPLFIRIFGFAKTGPEISDRDGASDNLGQLSNVLTSSVKADTTPND
jgi:hypothetical protein